MLTSSFLPPSFSLSFLPSSLLLQIIGGCAKDVLLLLLLLLLCCSSLSSSWPPRLPPYYNHNNSYSNIIMMSILITDAAVTVGRNCRSTEEGRALSTTWRRDSVWCPMRGRPYTDTGMGRHIDGSAGNAPMHGCLHSPLLKHICKHHWDKNKRWWTRWLLLNGKLLSWAKPDLSRGPNLLFEGVWDE